MARFERRAERPWSVPVSVSEVPETGRHLDLVADEPTRAAIAELAGLSGLPRLVAAFDLALRGRSGVHVVGHVSATVGQTCVVTLEPIENEIDEAVDLIFVPPHAASRVAREAAETALPADDPPEPLLDGTVDLGAIATEFLLLGIDPYPRKPGAVFQAPAGGDDIAHPFAALAALKKGQADNEG
jgi:uncharacterized metal-binding protein YceD (DUF177 family)